jgi:hypothetical protein
MVTYWCRSCGRLVGRLDLAADDPRLGLQQLTPTERAAIIGPNAAGRTEVRVLCDRCLPDMPDVDAPEWQ